MTKKSVEPENEPVWCKHCGGITGWTDDGAKDEHEDVRECIQNLKSGLDDMRDWRYGRGLREWE